jgi:predicted HAD superfamily Cof-like phosphohydrolase
MIATIHNIIPTGAYDKFVSDIISKSNSKYYHDTSVPMTICRHLKIKIANTSQTIINIKNEIDSKRKTIDKLNEENREIKVNPDFLHINNLVNLKNASEQSKNTSDKSNKYLKQLANIDIKIFNKFKNNIVQIDTLSKDIEELIEELYFTEETLRLDNIKLPELELNDMVREAHESRLDAAERVYRKNKDIEELRRLVHYTCDLNDKYFYYNSLIVHQFLVS